MKSFVIVAAMLLFGAAAYADWIYIPTEKLLRKTDLVVVASLTEVREITAGNMEYGSGVLVVSEVLRGSPKLERKLRFEWSNPAHWVCPGVEPRKYTGQSVIWLLERSANGAYKAGYPGRVLPLSERAHLVALLGR